MTSAIMRRPEVDEPTNESDQHGPSTAQQRSSLVVTLGSAPTWLDVLVSSFERRELHPRLAELCDTLVSTALLCGAFVVPIATLIAVVCAWLPRAYALHRAAPTFFALASLWFIGALLLSHLQPRMRQLPRETA